MAAGRAVVTIGVFDRCPWNEKRMNTPPISTGLVALRDMEGRFDRTPETPEDRATRSGDERIRKAQAGCIARRITDELGMEKAAGRSWLVPAASAAD